MLRFGKKKTEGIFDEGYRAQSSQSLGKRFYKKTSDLLKTEQNKTRRGKESRIFFNQIFKN